MKKILLSVFTLICLHTFGQETMIKDDNAEKRSLSGSFSAIKVSDGIQLYLSQGDQESVAVSASDTKYLERFKTVVENGVLRIYYDNSAMIWNGNEKKKLKAYVSFKTLERLQASSGSSVNAKSTLKLANLELRTSSGAEFNGDVQIENLTVDQSSGSQTTITGTSNHLKVESSSGALFKGYDLTASFCDAKASSGGEVRINVTKELAAKASSGGGVRYKGDAAIKDLNVSSGGMVKKS